MKSVRRVTERRLYCKAKTFLVSFYLIARANSDAKRVYLKAARISTVSYYELILRACQPHILYYPPYPVKRSSKKTQGAKTFFSGLSLPRNERTNDWAGYRMRKVLDRDVVPTACHLNRYPLHSFVSIRLFGSTVPTTHPGEATMEL